MQKASAEQPEQHYEQQQQIVLPISSDPNQGIVQMLIPKLTQFQNKTFANMINQFQQALGEHMTNHLAKEQHEEAAVQERKRQKASKMQDEQEDLMVALMAANMNQGGGASGVAGNLAGLPESAEDDGAGINEDGAAEGRPRSGSRAFEALPRDEDDEDRVDARNAASRLAASTF